ncbi:Ferrous iron permease EfeU [Methyloligella halotolerans]|uniref:Ferrous iron permease EfeU n=1 Tax=Methyloligella halotolerans TaxID=1177755 RepID=A0A1E2RXQ4_9HYPH|nr:iron uptake transporter permease EfeU [Methyloligella halotolerans]ODA67026.1 Ferrous iron permease EfeU [Methyloligella halotolerans]
MLAPFLIMLREGLEAALITGIIATYLRQTGRSAWMPLVWIGIFLAVAMSLFVGAALQWVSAEFPQKMQELFEACVGLVAVVVLTSMVFWMRKAARSIKAELHHSIDNALHSSAAGWALIGMVFFAVAREGLESIFFLLAIFQQSTGPAMPLAALAGVLISVAAGFAIYFGGLRLNLKRFFRWTGIFILFVAAGILAGAVGSLHEAGLWNGLQTPAWDLSAVLPVSSVLGAVLSGLLGYQESPSIGEVIVYLAFLAVSLYFFLQPYTPSAEAHSTAALKPAEGSNA